MMQKIHLIPTTCQRKRNSRQEKKREAAITGVLLFCILKRTEEEIREYG